MGERVCAVIVTYNRKALLRECLQAVLSQTRPPDHVLVVDNASTDGTLDMLQAEFPQVEVLRLPENRGGAGGFHEGIKWAYNQGFERIWMMDDDVSPEGDCLKELLAANNDGYIRIPLHIWNDTGEIAELAATKFDLKNPFIRDPRRSWVSLEYKDARLLPKYLAVLDFSFEGLLIHRCVVDKIGLPDGRWFIYGDDTDYALRARKAGFNLILVRDAIVRKLIRGNYSSDCQRAYYAYRNGWRIHMVHGENILVRAVKPFIWANYAALKYILRRDWDRLGVVRIAYQHAKTGVLGRYTVHCRQ